MSSPAMLIVFVPVVVGVLVGFFALLMGGAAVCVEETVGERRAARRSAGRTLASPGEPTQSTHARAA